MSVLKRYGARSPTIAQPDWSAGWRMTFDPLAWFERRTWHHTDFDPARLTTRARAAGVTASVVIPALNEEAAVAAVVASARRLEGLVDEVVVIDGGSEDATVAVAKAAGARVLTQQGLLSEAGPGRGKGDAMWKGLACTSSQLVVFLDADLADADERYVVGLLGPLLHDPAVGYVKACYERPLRIGDLLHPSGGGRVTELLARPLLAAFWPELAGVAQPLSGEYAGRRQLLEQVPFVQGFGVEFGLLVDVAAEFGVDAIGQVDLGRRLHGHRPLAALGRMAAEILAVAADRLQATGRLTAEPAGFLPQPVRGDADRLRLEVQPVTLADRPPLCTLR